MDQEQEKTQAVGEGEKQEAKDADLFFWLQALVTAVVVLTLLFTFVVRINRVDGHSMDNTLQHNELLLVWSLGYTPKTGDIVIVDKPTATILRGNAIVKRVIATGGQTVDIDYENSTVYVDGQALDEPYINETMYLPGDPYMQQTHFEIPEGSVFVMGDNRNGSTDSRHELVGAVDNSFVLGHAVFSFWPLSKAGTL